MEKAEKTKKDAKKQKTSPKTAQNRPKTRETLAEKKEPPRAAQMMQAHGKAKLVKELQEHRAEQKAEERRSEQSQAVDTLSEEVEVTAGAAIEEGMNLLERDLQRFQEWRHADPPPLPPLEEVPSAPEPVYPISPPKSDKPRKLPSRQVSRFPSTTSAVKTKPARSIPTGRVTLSPKNPTSQVQVSKLMQARGKLLFRRKRMKAQRVKLQQRHETAYSAHESKVLKEIYPIAERSSTSPKPSGRPVSQPPISQSYTPRTPDYRRIGASPQKFAPISAQDKRRLIMQKRQETKYQATDYPISAHPRGNEFGIAESPKLSTCSTESVKISQNFEFTEFRAGRAIQKPVIEPSGSPQTQIPMAQERRKLVLKRRAEEHRYTAMLDQKTAPLGTEYEGNHAKSFEFVQVRTPTVQERRRMVLKKRLGAHRYTLNSNPAIKVSSPNFEENRAKKSVSMQIRAPTAQERRKLVLEKRLDTHQEMVKLEQNPGFPVIDFEKNHAGSPKFLQMRPLTVQERRKLILGKRSSRRYTAKTSQSLPVSNGNVIKSSTKTPESVQTRYTSK